MQKKHTCCDDPRIVKNKRTGKRRCRRCGTKISPKSRRRDKPLPGDALVKRRKPGAKVFSPWYNDEFVAEKVEEKKAALARL